MTLYRTFDNPHFADNFANGKIRISTIQRCREIEDKVRQDLGEGTLTYNTGFIDGNDAAALQLAARRAGIRLAGNGKAVLFNNSCKQQLTDAYVLCLSRVIVPKFGQHVVRIDHPRLLFRAISKALGAFDLEYAEQGWMLPIQYRARFYKGLERAPPHMGFIKPVVPFAEEREVRMLWHSASDKQLGFCDLSCPEAVRYCTPLSSPPSKDPPAISEGEATPLIIDAQPAL